MTRGSKPTPTALLEVHGTRRPDRHGTAETDVVAEGTVAADDPPEWMTEAQKAGWRFAVENAPRFVLKRIDRAALTAFVVAEDRFVTATKTLNKLDEGATLPLLAKGQKGEAIVSPYVRISNHAMLIMARMAAELGFTPASRPRLNTALGGDMPAEPLTGGQARGRGDDFDRYLATKPNRTTPPPARH